MGDGGEDKEPFSEFPETVEFVGQGNPSLKSAHLISIAVLAVGLAIAAIDYPGGLLLLIIFILIVLGFEFFIYTRTQKPVKVVLRLREDPVEASQGMFNLGPVETGTIDPDMEGPTELGFRPAPNRELLVWKFKTKEDKDYAARRLLQYLQRDQE